MDHKQVKADFYEWWDTAGFRDSDPKLTAYCAWQAAVRKYTDDYGKPKDAQSQGKLEFEKET